MPRSHCFPIVCAIFLTTGCEDPSAPLAIPSSYVARSVEGTSLPATFIHGDAADVALVADTIHFHFGGLAERISIQRLGRIEGVTVDTIRSRESYTVQGHSVFFHRYCPPDANCVGPPEGVFSADRRRLFLRLWRSGPLVVYDRVRP